MASAKPVQRCTAKRRSALVLSVVRGETSVQEAARKHGLTVGEVEDWRERFLSGAENSVRSRPRDDEALREQELMPPAVYGVLGGGTSAIEVGDRIWRKHELGPRWHFRPPEF